jgi:hypothetical protein
MGIKNCLIQQNRMFLKHKKLKFKHRKIAVSNPQLSIP